MQKLAVASLVILAMLFGASVAPRRAAEAGSNIVWKDCHIAFQCGTLRVPLDHSRPREEQIEIALIRAPAKDPGARIGSLLVNFGGPGGQGVETVLNAANFFPRGIQDHFDIIGFDPRGVGLSSDVDCIDDFDSFPDLDSTPGTRSYDQQVTFWRDFARDCQQRSGKLLQFVDTNSAARDMDRIREELGEEQMNYLGFSYGSLLGQAYADLFPERVRALVIDGVLDPANSTEDMLVETAEGADIALNGFFDACRAAPTCAFQAPDLAAAYDLVVADAEKDPLGGWDFPITADLILQTTFGAMYDPLNWSTLAEALRQAYEEGSGVGFGVMISGLEPPDDEIDYTNSFEAFSSISCVDFLQVEGEAGFKRILAAATTASPRFGAYVSYAYALPCAFWPGAPRRPVAPVVAEGSAPILVISSRYDPITRYDFGVAVAQQLESAALLTSENYGHVSHGACAEEYTVAYLVELQLPPAGATCPNPDEPFPFDEPEPWPPEVPIVPPPAPVAPALPTGTISPPDTGTASQQPTDRLRRAAFALLVVAASALAAGGRVFAGRAADPN